MLKIKDKIMQNLYRSDLSNYEQLFFIELVKRSDERGIAKGINYRYFSEEIGCSKANFYVLMTSLYKKGFIEYKRSKINKTDWDILIVGNDFSKEEIHQNYTKLNISLFNSNEYVEMKAGERRVVFYLVFKAMKQSFDPGKEDKANNYKARTKRKKYEEMAKEIRITKRMLKSYCKELSKNKIISIGRDISINGKKFDIITPAVRIIDRIKEVITEHGALKPVRVNESFYTHLQTVETLCRKCKVKFDKQNLKDTAVLINQYAKKAKSYGKEIQNVIVTAINHIKNSCLESKNINRIIQNIIIHNDDTSIIVFE